eukprot:431830-Pelagomonas_calceolata.AAC.1
MKGNYAGHQKEYLRGRHSSSAGIVGCAAEGMSFSLATPGPIFGGQALVSCMVLRERRKKKKKKKKKKNYEKGVLAAQMQRMSGVVVSRPRWRNAPSEDKKGCKTSSAHVHQGYNGAHQANSIFCTGLLASLLLLSCLFC